MTERKPGVWTLRVYVGNDEKGRPQQATRTFCGGKRDASAALARFVIEAKDGTVGRPSSETFGSYLDYWLAQITPLRSPTTIRGYKSHITAIKEVRSLPGGNPLGSKQLSKLRAHDLDSAYTWWLNDGRSLPTVRHRHNIIGAALAQAVKWDRISQDVSDTASPPPMRTRPIPRVQPAAVRTLIKAAEKQNPTLAAAIALAAVLGARRGELCGLRWSDTDLDGRFLWIERSAKYDSGKNVIMGDVKNHQPRRVPLDPFAVAILTTHRSNAEKIAADAGVVLVKDGYVLTPPITSVDFDPTGATPIDPDYITQSHRNLAGKLGLAVRFHDLRHFAATEMVKAKIDPKTGAGRLGHDPVVYMRMYVAAIEENEQEAANVLGRALADQRLLAGEL